MTEEFSSSFGEVEYDVAPLNEAGDPMFSRTDTTQYDEFIADLATRPKGTVVSVKVLTGPPVQAKSGKGRGKNELADSRQFAAAASRAGHGLRQGQRHQADGVTVIRMMLTKKKEFPESASLKRNAAVALMHFNKTMAKAQADPGNQELQNKAKEQKARLDAANALVAKAGQPAAPAKKSE